MSILILVHLLVSNFAEAACPAPWDTADCIDANSVSICSMSSNEYTCDASRGGASGTSMYATYNTGHDVCDEDYCFFGTDSNGDDFCCELSSSTMYHIIINGGPTQDMVQLSFPSPYATYLDTNGAAGGFTVDVSTGAGEDAVSTSGICSTGFVQEIWLGPGDDDLSGSGNCACTVHGGDDWDIIYGSNYGDSIFGDDGDDYIWPGNGTNTVYAGDGDDIVGGGPGSDTIHGGPGSDIIRGGSGNDYLYGDNGVDSLFGDDGDDVIYGGDQADALCGGDDTDNLYGELGDDQLWDDNILDHTYGGGGTDTCESNTTAAGSPNCDTITHFASPCWSY
jgi:Ca2+-binding RTX toxin-like protein